MFIQYQNDSPNKYFQFKILTHILFVIYLAEDSKEKQKEARKRRKRKAAERDEISPNASRKAQNRIYCRENRQKKKEYVSELESKIHTLEQEVTRLNTVIDKYRYKLGIHAIGEEKDFGEFNELQEYKRQTAIRSLEQTNDQETLQKNIEEFAKFAGLASNDRQKLIKAAIRVVIDNIVPHRVRILFKMTDTKTNPSLEDIKKLFKADKKRFEVDIKDPKFSDIDRLHYYTGVDPITYHSLRSNCRELFKDIRVEFQNCIHDLIKTRNKIFNLQLRFKRYGTFI